VVQTQDRRPVPFPDKDSLVFYDRLGPLKTRHPCPKPVEEMLWLVEALTRPGEIVLDCFCGLGATLLAAQRLGRPFVGCDISRLYCKITLRRLRAARAELAKPTVGAANGPDDRSTSPKGKGSAATPQGSPSPSPEPLRHHRDEINLSPDLDQYEPKTVSQVRQELLADQEVGNDVAKHVAEPDQKAEEGRRA
jgi:hypothetical protein